MSDKFGRYAAMNAFWHFDKTVPSQPPPALATVPAERSVSLGSMAAMNADTLPIESLLRYIQDRLSRLEDANNALADQGEPNAVHAVRVTSRRLTEALELVRPLAGARPLDKAISRLRRLRQALCRAREIDVLQVALADPNSGGELGAAQRAQLEGELTRRRTVALGKVLGKVRRLGDASQRRVESVVDSLMGKAIRRNEQLSASFREHFADRADTLLRMEVAAPDSTDLHPARIALKRFRYCCELGERVGLCLLPGLVGELTQAQDLLGAWNDHVCAARDVAKLAIRRRHLSGQSAWSRALLTYSVGRLQLAEATREAVVAAWPRVESAVRDAQASLSGSAAREEAPRNARPTGVST